MRTTQESIVGKWGYSHDGELYNGQCGTRDEAIAEGGDDARYVGKFGLPDDPESFLDADDIIEKIQCQDDYCFDFAENWPDCTKQQRDELTDALRTVFAGWLDKYQLRPTWGVVENSEEIKK